MFGGTGLPAPFAGLAVTPNGMEIDGRPRVRTRNTRSIASLLIGSPESRDRIGKIGLAEGGRSTEDAAQSIGGR